MREFKFFCPNCEEIYTITAPKITRKTNQACPKCDTAPPYSSTVVTMHLVAPDKKGKIIGKDNKKLSIVCRKYLGNIVDEFTGTTCLAQLVTCPDCRKIIIEQLEKETKTNGSAT